eukprot:Sspe_Gene.54941::Locus_30268_Transcript_1_1_Confidence_1.000_Length_663::g.54941::m.54941
MEVKEVDVNPVRVKSDEAKGLLPPPGDCCWATAANPPWFANWPNPPAAGTAGGGAAANGEAAVRELPWPKVCPPAKGLAPPDEGGLATAGAAAKGFTPEGGVGGAPPKVPPKGDGALPPKPEPKVGVAKGLGGLGAEEVGGANGPGLAAPLAPKGLAAGALAAGAALKAGAALLEPKAGAALLLAPKGLAAEAA